MTSLAVQVLKLFVSMDKDCLDLHVLFEAGGNIPAERGQVLDAIDELTAAGMLEATGADFYTLTAKGRNFITPS